jgi:membrane dipeptidase
MRFFDAHCDAVMHAYWADFDFVGGDSVSHVDLPRLLQAGYCGQVFAVFAPQRRYAGQDVDALARRAITTIHGWAGASAGRLHIIRTAADVRDACDEGAVDVSGLIGLEGADPIGTADNLAAYAALGVRLVIPAWEDNQFSGTSMGEGRGLSKEGFRLVELCEHLGVMVDVSHLSDAAFNQVLATTAKPFVASHSNCRSLCPSPRNLTDGQIRALAGRGGVMGINFAPDFLDPAYLAAWDAIMAGGRGLDTDAQRQYRVEARPRLAAIPRPRLDTIAGHVVHALRLGGEDCVGLGGDLDGITYTPDGIAGSQSYPAIPDALAAAGLTPRQIEKVCYGNMARVFADVLPE